jgi:hypothetical protein
MKNAHPDRPNISLIAASVSLIMAGGALVCLASLHFLSPEFDPSWRVVSEYALGSYGWVLSLMFLAWAISSWSLGLAICSQVKTLSGRIGLIFLATAGVGEALAAGFDVTWPMLHGLAALLGVPTLPIAATLISVSLGSTEAWAAAKKRLIWTAALTWMSLSLMAAAMFTLKGRIAGVQVQIGWPNRLLIVTYTFWAMSVALEAIRLRITVSRPLYQQTLEKKVT